MHTSTPVSAGVPFDVLNPRMDQKQQVPPATIPVYAVNGKPYLSEPEADRHAESLTTFGTSAEIRGGEVSLDSLKVLRTVPAVPADPAKPETLPSVGLFSLDQWAETLNLSVETIQDHLRDHRISLTDGRIDAAEWWRAIAGKPKAVDTSISSATFTNAAVDARFEGTTTQPGANQEVVSRLPEMTTADIVHVTSQVRMPKPKPAWHALPICGLVTINNLDWEPKSRLDVPPSPTMNLGMDIAAQFAIAYNQSDFARQKRRWCVVTNRGTCLILTGIPADQRPLNPCDFPPIVQQGLTFPEAEKAADEQNTERHRLARIPRNWTVALRRADSVQRND